MFQLNDTQGPSPKCFFTTSVLPSFVNAEQIPSKKRPFSTISDYPLVHTVDVILSHEAEVALRQAVGDASSSKFTYARVHMKLSEIVSGDFFNQYIKTGTILMLSEGRGGTDHTFSLVEGTLRFEVDKATFERMGLEGKPIPTAGRKHVKTRYAVELNLRLPSMVRGKKGFERILWAFRNVLDRSLTWLFYDLRCATDGSGPISTHQPLIKTIETEIRALPQVAVPPFPQITKQEDYDIAIELLEWLTLAAADSPRVRTQDTADSYLSRYQVPNSAGDALEGVSTQDLARVRWHGFMPSQRLQDIYLAALKSSGDKWFAMNVHAFDGHAYTILQNLHNTSTWEYMA